LISGTVSATFRSAGNDTITGTDTAVSTITGTSAPPVVVTGLTTTTHFGVSVAGTPAAGTPFSFTVTAEDQFNNPTGAAYTGTVHFSSSSSSASLPADSTLTNGTGTFSATYTSSGTLVASDTNLTGITGSTFINLGGVPPQTGA